MANSIYYLNQYITTTLSQAGGINDSTTTDIVLASTDSIECSKPGIALLTYDDPLDTDVAEWVSYTSINSSTKALEGVTRGQEGFSAKSHSNGAAIAFPISKSHINNLNKAVEIGGVATNALEGFKDEDDMASDSATHGATQQSIKAYVDSSVQTATDGATVTFDLGNGAYRKHKVTLGGNRTLALSNVLVGQVFIINLIQDATGSRTVTWFSTIKWAGGSAPTLTTGANTIDTFGFICTSSGNYQGYIVGQDVS